MDVHLKLCILLCFLSPLTYNDVNIVHRRAWRAGGTQEHLHAVHAYAPQQQRCARK